MEDRPPLKSIIDAWKAKVGETRVGERGSVFVIIPNSRRLECLKILAKTLKNYGLTDEEIDSPHLSKLIVDTCWKEKKIKRMSLTEIRKAKEDLAEDWDEVIHGSEFSGIEIAELSESEKMIPVQRTEVKREEKPLEIDPSDRIVMDTSDMREVPLDDEILSELEAIGTFLKEKDE